MPHRSSNRHQASPALLPTTHKNPHPHQDHHHAHKVPHGQRNPIDHQQPNQRHRHVDRSIGGINPSCCCGMQREQPGKDHKRERRRDEQQRRPAALEVQIGQVAPNDLSKCREDEQQGGPKHSARSVMGGCSRFTPPQSTTPLEPPAPPPLRTQRRVREPPSATRGTYELPPLMPS